MLHVLEQKGPRQVAFQYPHDIEKQRSLRLIGKPVRPAKAVLLRNAGEAERLARKSAHKHVVRSGDGGCALWLGTIDDLWGLGKPRGTGGPWENSTVRSGEPSDPYLMAGYDRKSLTLAHDALHAVTFQVDIDISGTEEWRTFRTIAVPPGGSQAYSFPTGFQAYWVRLRASHDCRATARLVYD